MSQKKDNQNVLVGVRIRPRNEKEIQASMPVYFNQTVDSQSVQELDENGIPIKHWGFDRVFGPESTNREIFETMGMKLVDGALEGYNTVMFMYGQTSSGKTFTLFGDNNNLGVIDHAMEYLNHRVKTSIDIEYVIKLTYAELYNEELKDLLSATPNDNLKIIEDPNLGPMIQNITEASFASAADIRQILDEGERRRHFGVTNMNAHSSRSHVIVRLCIESRKVPYRPGNALRQSWGKDRPTCISTLNLVDLAGSERANKAGTTGQALKEGSYINKSLLTLGTVIANLSEGKLQHIPYRNSKLTRLLATALGGNAKTCVITCISPASGNLAESLNTLRFASRAKRVVNHVQKNEIMDMKTLTNKLALQLTEIEGLRAQLEMARQIGYVPDEEEANSGETIRDKAIMISKYWRSLRFFLANGGKMITFLRSVGMSHLAKKIPSDLRGIISGGREISEVLEDYSSILQTYLQKEGRGLLGKIQEIMTVNESEVIINLSTMFENMFPDLDDNSTNNSVVDLSSLFQECDVFHLLEDGGEELKEQLETTQFYNEDIFNRFNIFSNRHTQEINDWVNKEKQYKKQVEELQYSVVEKNETIKQLRQSESLLTHQIENSVEKWKSDVSSQKGFITDLTNKMGSLELKITDQETVIHMKEQELMYRDFEIDKYKNQIEQLNADLANANQLKKQIEEESTRQRSEMRVQMERLRQNMHELLIQGGEEAKVIESHNSQLQHEIDTLKDELTAAISVKQRVEMENQQLRSQLSITLEDLKVQFHSATTLKDEKMDLLNKIRDSKLEITKYQSEITFLQQNLLKVEQENELNKNQYDELLLAKDKEIELIQYRNKMKINDLNLEIEMKDTELESFKDQLQQKQTFLIRFEQSYSSDMNRLEKKLFHQTKLADELSVENNNLYLQMQSLHHKYNEEIRQLKQKNQELQHSIDSINNYIEDKEKELFLPDNNHNDVENDKNDEIQGSYLAHSLMRQQDQKGSGGSSSKKSLSRYASRFYLNDNGKVLNNFNSYYDMSSFYSSAPSTLNSDVADDWSDLASSPSNRRDSGRHQRRFSFQSDLPEDDYMYDDDDLSVQSSTVRNHLQPTASTEKMEKIKQFNDYYQGDKKDEFDIPLVQIDENFSVSNDFDHSYPIIQGQSKTHLPFTPPPISASPAARSIMQKKKSDLGASGGLMTSPPSQTPSSAPKVKFLSHSLHESAEPGAQLTPVPALTVNTTASWSPDPFPDGESELLKPEESPKRALDDPRLVQQLKQYEIEHQQQFESIYYGLSLSTLLLEVIYEEEKLLRQGNYSQHHQQFQQSLQQQSEINNIIIEKDSLYEKNQQLVNSLNFLQEKNEFLTKIYKELEEKYNKLIHEYTTITHSDRLKQTQLYSLEENMLSEKVKIDKYQLENHRYQQVIYDLKVNNLTLQSDKEVLEEKLSIMESQLDLIKQEKDLLSVERDEVIRRFLPNLLKK